MELRRGYKQTEVGVIPEDWGLSLLDEVCDRISVGLATSVTKHYRTSGVPIVRNLNIKNGYFDDHEMLYVSEEFAKANFSKAAKAFDVLTVHTGSNLGQTCVLPSSFHNCQTFTTLITTPKQDILDPYFLCIHLSSSSGRNEMDRLQVGGGKGNLNSGDLKKYRITIPALSEQRTIAALSSDTDALIESLEQLITKKRNIKQGAMQELLIGKKRLPGFSEEWEVKTFGAIFDYQPTATNSRSDLIDDGDSYYIHYGDIHTRFHSHLDFRVDQPPRIQRSKCRNATLLKNGDWVLADASEDFDGVGKSIEILGLEEGIAAVAGLHTFLLREKNLTFVPGFKGHLGNLKSLHDEFLRVATGMKVYGVSKKALKNLLLPIPKLDEQTAIATILSDMDAEIAALETKLTKIRSLKQGMMHELLTGKTRLI